MRFDSTTQKNIDLWLQGDCDQEAIHNLIQNHPDEAIDAFYTTLSFGTGGLRGLMGVGSNRMNVYTVQRATQGLAQYIAKNREPGKEGVFIGFDSRHHSKAFAEEAAKVLSANRIKVFLCREMRPVPFISFGCRYKQCQAAIAITASHNPAAYNGYKVYWSDGGQVVPPRDVEIMEEIAEVTCIKTAPHALIETISEEVDTAYLEAIDALQNYPEDNRQYGEQLKITYTPLHGTGITLAPQALSRWGFNNLNFVERQMLPDGDFPTVSTPNPEEEQALALGIEAMTLRQSDLLLATDPDADRLGVVVMHQGKPHRLNGHQVACLCLEHICNARKQPNAACIKTIVTSELFQAIATAHQIPCFNVSTGGKYIAEKIRSWEKTHHHFLFGAEESYGYMLGTYTRDKDGIAACALIAEIALRAKRQGKTLLDLLNDLYAHYGAFAEEQRSHKFPETKEGREQMANLIRQLQHSPPTHLLNTEIIAIDNHHSMLTFWLADRTKLVVRPSGTEPKIKFYCGVHSKTIPLDACRTLANRYLSALADQCETQTIDSNF